MSITRRAWLAALLSALSAVSVSRNALPACMSGDVETHVRQQFAIYGPLSIDREYFGVMYRSSLGHSADIESAVTRSSKCSAWNCMVNVAGAARAIPRGASIVGEWHTHPHSGSRQLSESDVRGAYYLNHRLSCYAAFFSRPDGEIVAWNPRESSVAGAMASLVRIGNYERDRIVIDDHGTYVASRAVHMQENARTAFKGSAGVKIRPG